METIPQGEMRAVCFCDYDEIGRIVSDASLGVAVKIECPTRRDAENILEEMRVKRYPSRLIEGMEEVIYGKMTFERGGFYVYLWKELVKKDA